MSWLLAAELVEPELRIANVAKGWAFVVVDVVVLLVVVEEVVGDTDEVVVVV